MDMAMMISLLVEITDGMNRYINHCFDLQFFYFLRSKSPLWRYQMLRILSRAFISIIYIQLQLARLDVRSTFFSSSLSFEALHLREILKQPIF